ncbi:MAG: rod shape-determining protein MreC [Phycisphaerales bacterium]|nr:rod shape-determining protein MreC [Phycisphaerales bacterium]
MLSPTGWLLVVLLCLSSAALLLPRSWTRRFVGITQVIAPLQDGATRAADAARAIVNDDVDTTGREMAAWRTMAVSLAAQNEALRERNADLTRVRERVMGSRGRLIPARVIADDPLAWRRSKRITAGARDGARRGDAVTSQWFSIDLGGDAGAVAGMGVLSAESLIGIVENANAMISQVRLLSDPATRMAVTIGRLEGDAFASSGAAFWLVGVGGRIEIHDVHHQYVDNGDVRGGDVILTLEDDATLPPSLVIGTVAGMERDPGNGLLYVLDVDPGFDVDDLRGVYVVDWRP